MTPTPIRSIALTMVVSFCLALAYFWWQQHPFAPVPSVRLPQTPGMQRTSVPPPRVPHDRQSDITPVSAPAPRALAVPETPQPNYEGPPLPVLFAVTTETVTRGESNGDEPHAESESADTPTSVKRANISNASDQPLDVTVIAVDIPTQKTSQASVFLTPGGQQSLGPDAGLHMESGDQITLRSRGFHDLTETVP
jgi:hypothetical protein